MEKPQLINFIANLLEDSGFKVYKNFKTTQQMVDIYAILPTSMGDFALVLGCKNYDKNFSVGIDVLKEMEMAGKNLKASRVGVITSSKFSEQARLYSEEKHIKLVDRDDLIRLAKEYNEKKEKAKKEKEEKEKPKFYTDYYTQTLNNGLNESDYDDYYYDAEDINRYNDTDDEKYRAKYLTQSYYNQINTPHRQTPSLNRGGVSKTGMMHPRTSLTKSKNKINNNQQKVNYRKINQPQKVQEPLSQKIKPILKNPAISIFVVVVISYLINFILKKVTNIPRGYLGLIELVLASIMAFGLTIYTDNDNPNFLMKAALIFFVSLIILIVLILFV